MRSALLFSCLLFSPTLPVLAQTAPETKPVPIPGTRLELRAETPSFPLGEPIELLLRYTYEGDGELHVTRLDFDRSGRVGYYSFSATGEDGKAVRDPSIHLRGDERGGARYSEKLSKEKPFEQRVVINQWLAFDKPGRYKVVAESEIVSTPERMGFGKGPKLVSAPLEIIIGEPDEGNRQARLGLAQLVIQPHLRQTGQANRDSRLKVIRDLRYMLDERAIPHLVRALSDEYVNNQLEAQLGLRSFPSLAPVKTEILRVLDDDGSVVDPGASWLFSSMIGYAYKEAVPTPPEGVKDPVGFGELRTKFKSKIERQIERLPSAEGAKQTVEGLREHAIDGSSKNWKRILSNASELSQEEQSKAADLLASQAKQKPEDGSIPARQQLVEIQDMVKGVAQNAKLNGRLRVAAIFTLHKLGDDSLRDLLVNDLAEIKPKLLYETESQRLAKEVLSDYRAVEIANKLYERILELTEDKTSENYSLWYSRVRLMRDFGRAASLTQLKKVYERVDNELPFRPSNFEVRVAAFTAVAVKDGDTAVALLREFAPPLPKTPQAGRSEVIRNLLVRIDTPAAANLRDEILTSDVEWDKRSLMYGLSDMAEEARGFKPPQGRALEPKLEIVNHYVPRLIEIYQKDPNKDVRQTAFYALREITRLPLSYEEKLGDEAIVKSWKEWVAADGKIRK